VTTRDHDLHHSSYHYNFGFHFTWWDRLMGTEHPSVEISRIKRWFRSATRVNAAAAKPEVDSASAIPIVVPAAQGPNRKLALNQ
jgi:sterol desaturase/sphingolipid hydroxylase (fatty acid hydroxylase superfamily)